ncbi:TPA: hypothetical protein L4E52_006594 [Pseudomonas aeruginosa]|nr:hypothetical protein [Pseudomonas aeruginosa]
MSNELTDVRCPCGAEFQADSYDAGFIAGSGMCQNCDAALPPKDICTCPSGDGSLRHPCPAHPASVELAGAAAKLTFINGRPAMCGCQVEYSSGGGEYSDVIDVTLCAKHSGSAILDLVATNRIALTPEYEGQWHADLYLDREIPLAKAEGATPAEAVLALMSAERIDPEQGGVDQAGGDRWDALQSIMEWTAAENIPDDRKLCLIRNAARAALAQPSPAPTLRAAIDVANDRFEVPVAKWGTDLAGEEERPEVVAFLMKPDTYEPYVDLTRDWSCDHWEALMTVTQYERITGQLHDALDESDGDRWKLRSERDAAMARVAEYEAQAQHSVPGNAAALVRAEAKKYSLNAAGMLDSGAPEHAQTFAIVQLLSEFDDEEAERHWEAIMAYSDFRTSDALFRAAELLAAAPGKEGV